MAEQPPTNPKRNRWLLAVMLACVAWTLPVLFGWRTHFEQGPLTKAALWSGEYWRLGTAILLHHDWLHLSLNLLSLYFVGRAVAIGLGSRPFMVFTFAAAFAGHAASLLLTVPDALTVPRMGISGGVFGLLGVILGIEYCDRPRWGDFLKRRNVRLVLFFLILNVGLGLFFPMIDQAAHLGGFVAGLVLSVAAYGPRRLHLLRAAAAGVVLVVLPLAYAIHPFASPTFYLFRGELFDRRKEPREAEAAYARLLELDPGHPKAIARLADMRDDPGLLGALNEPVADKYKGLVAGARWELARRRLESDPEAAQRLLEDAVRHGHVRAEMHELLARVAERNGDVERAHEAIMEAIHRRRDRNRREWRHDLEALRVTGLRLEQLSAQIDEQWRLYRVSLTEPEPARSLLATATQAAVGTVAGGLDIKRPRERVQLGIVRMSARALLADSGASDAERQQAWSLIRAVANEMELALIRMVGIQRWEQATIKTLGVETDLIELPPAAELSTVMARVARLWSFLGTQADTYGEPAAAMRLRAAMLMLQAAQLTGEQEDPERLIDIDGLFRGAYTQAVEESNLAVRTRAALWFRGRGLPLPD
ncbi:MAG: rhomboid family intramembrane serine protease [Planctomycetota bacterium]|nr:rhomboid family intramembrane serine protease [Planctomycetota bacterium]